LKPFFDTHWPVSSPDPLQAIHVAVNRRAPDAPPGTPAFLCELHDRQAERKHGDKRKLSGLCAMFRARFLGKGCRTAN